MKKIITFIFFVLNLTVYAQQWEWAKSINHTSYIPFKILQSSNTGFYLTGDFNGSISIDGHMLNNAGTSYFLGRFDMNGQCIWLKETFCSRDACTDVFGNIYLSGFFSGQIILDNEILNTTYDGAGIIAKYTPSGNLTNLEKFDGAFGCKIKVNSLNQLIVCSGYRDSANYKGNLFSDSTGVLLKLDTGLNLLQANQTCAFSYALQIELDMHDSIYMVCNKDYSCMYCGVTKILKYSPDLSLLIDHLYSSGVGTNYYQEPIITSHSDGNLYVMQPNVYSENYGLKYSSQLNKIWGKQLYWRGSLISKNNKLFAMGRTAEMECVDSILKSSIIIELDTALSCLWNKALPVDNILTGPGAFFANSFIDASNNVFVTGFADRKTGFDSDTINSSNILSAFIAKVNYSGIATDVNNYEVNTKLLIFPNPTSGVFTINFYEEMIETKICVYDVLGNCLLKKNCRKDLSQIIDLSGQRKGIYFMEVVSDLDTVVMKIVLQ